jgi:hypothetical protein
MELQPFTQYLLSNEVALDDLKCFDPFSHRKTMGSRFIGEEFTSLLAHQSETRYFDNLRGEGKGECASELLKLSRWLKQNCQERPMK